MGKVGDDAFGYFLASTLAEVEVDVSPPRFSPEARTMLTFVPLRSNKPVATMVIRDTAFFA